MATLEAAGPAHELELRVSDTPAVLFAKLMSLPEGLVPVYWDMVLDMPFDGDRPADESRREMARLITQRIHGAQAAGHAEAGYDSRDAESDAAAGRVEEQDLSVHEVRSRAITGAAVVAMRGLAIRALAFLGNIVLARLLVPHDFGLVAFGTSLMNVAQFLTAAGIGAGLIRRPEAPTRTELGSLLGLQLAGTTALCAIVAVASWPFGQGGHIVAAMLIAMPLLVFRTPGTIMFERGLTYGPLVVVEVGETLAFYLYAIPAVLLGGGVWALATAYIVRAAAGSLLMLKVSPVGPVRPLFRLAPVRNLLGFGLKYEAVGLVSIVCQQALTIGTVAIAGVSTLGIWSLAKRILDFPGLLFESLWRVSYPAMSRLMSAGEKAAPIIERGVAMATVLTGGLMLLLVGPGPELIPLTFGQKWHAAAWIMPAAGLSAVISGPISVASAGYLYGIGEAGTILKSAIWTSVAWLVVLFALLPIIGLTAFGVGLLAGGLADAFVLVRATHRRCGARFRPALLPSTLASVGAGAAGWLSAMAVGHGWLSCAVGLLVAEAGFAAALWIFRRQLLLDTIGVGIRALTTAIGVDRLRRMRGAEAALEVR